MAMLSYLLLCLALAGANASGEYLAETLQIFLSMSPDRFVPVVSSKYVGFLAWEMWCVIEGEAKQGETVEFLVQVEYVLTS